MTFSITITPGWITPERRIALAQGDPPRDSSERAYSDQVTAERVNRLRRDGRRG